MRKTPATRPNPLRATVITPAAAVTSALLSPVAVSAPGDLDPDFGDLGRLGPILDGPAWSLEALDDGTTLLGGGDVVIYCYYYWYCYDAITTNFVGMVSDSGSTDSGFAANIVARTQVLDVVRQADGKVVAVGRKLNRAGDVAQLSVFRLRSDGPLDPTFGTAGVLTLSIADHGEWQVATSVVLDPDGRIVIAGSRDDQVLVLRLLPDGSFDDAFGTSGIFGGPDAHDFSFDGSGARTTILRTAAGGYRVTASGPAGCQVFALTADGVLDDTFGNAGIATIDAPSGEPTSCNAMTQQPDGRLLVVGNAAGTGFASRLLEDSQPDPGFGADAVSDAMTDATALAVAGDGSVFVAGESMSGASIMRLHANGGLDALFGNGGSTYIDLEADYASWPAIHDMAVREDGRVVAAGAERTTRRAFVVRLQGAAGNDAPGIIGVSPESLTNTIEENNDVSVKIRRTGGKSGEVSVAYEAMATDWGTARVNEDFFPVSGRLTWMDGDTADQQISVPIVSDNTVEGPESFAVMLSGIQGGAGLGKINVIVEIGADGSPYGQFGFTDFSQAAFEGHTVQLSVRRSYYYSGDVSVSLTPVSGSATAGLDFPAAPVTLSWADGDWGDKVAEFLIVNDTTAETTETFTVQLTNAAGGAVIGPDSTTNVSILTNDQPRPPAAQERKGGGAVGYFSLLFLGLMSLVRLARRR